MKWCLIQTAPRTRLIGYDKNRNLIYIMHWGAMAILPAKNGWVAEGAEKSAFSPTHWLPLPSLPNNESKLRYA